MWKSMGGPDGERELSLDEMARWLILVRIAPAAAVRLYSWADYLRMSGVRPSDAQELVTVARQRGATEDQWWVSFKAVPMDQWASVEWWVPSTSAWRLMPRHKWVEHAAEMSERFFGASERGQ